MRGNRFNVLTLALAAATALPAVVPTRAGLRAEARLAFSTYFGSLGDEYASGVATDAAGDVYLVGRTDSTTFPVANALQPAIGGGLDAFVAKLSPDGSRVLWATYFGGEGDDFGTGIAVDASGDAYVTGQTYSKHLPVTPGAYDDDNGRFPSCSGADCLDSFVAKISSDGSTLLYSTYLGGEHDDYAAAIAVDAEGHALITGTTNSFGFPRVNSFDGEKRQGTEAFITKMGADGKTVVYSSYLGGDRGDAGFAVTADAEGNAVFVGDTLSTDLVVRSPLQANNASVGSAETLVDAFVAKVDPTGALVFSTYLGGAGRDYARAVATDASGDIYVGGETASTNFPTVSPAQPASGGGVDAFVAKIRADGSAIAYSTYLGGSRDESVAGIGVTSANEAVVAGSTRSADFPAVDPLQATCGGGCVAPGYFSDAFLAELSPGGAAVERATFLGGVAEDTTFGLAVSAAGAATIAGRTFSTNFPTTDSAYQSSCACTTGNTESAFVARIDAAPVTPPPTIASVVGLKRPFRLQIDGTGFEPGARVLVGAGREELPGVVVASATRIEVGGGKALKARFPKGVAVPVVVVNPDGGEASSTFAR